MLRGEIHCRQAQRFSSPDRVKSWLSLKCKKAPGPQCCLSLLPGCSCSQTHTCAERGARNFLPTQLISGIFPLCLYLCWTKGSQGFKLITCDWGPLPNTSGRGAEDASSLACPKDPGVLEKIAQVQGMPGLDTGRTRKMKCKSIKLNWILKIY